LQNAGRIYGDETTYPNYAPPSPWQTQGYPDLFAATRPNQVQTGGLYNVADTAGNVQDWPTAKTYDAYGNLIAGGGTSPAQPGYAQFAAGQGGPQQTADRVVGNAVNAAYGYANPITGYASAAGANNNLGLSELGKFASGGYDANPYLPAAIAAAQRPVQLAYQESTAPTTDARFSGAGRYGSGANDAARVRDESALAGSLGDISTNMSYADFKAAMDRKAAASQQYGSLFNQGLTTAGNLQQAAGNLVDQGERTALSAADLTQRGQTAGLSGLDTGFGRGLTAEQNALTSFPQFIQSLFAPGLATAQAGAGLSAQQLAAARGEIEAGTGQQTLQQQAYNAPFERLRQYMATIGAPSGGASATQPIFGNPLTSALSGATGLVGLGKELGVGSLFSGGGGSALGGTFGGGGTAGAGFSSLGDAIAGGLPLEGFGFSAPAEALAASAAPAAGAAGKSAASALPLLAL
jgi:hypothetical protein